MFPVEAPSPEGIRVIIPLHIPVQNTESIP